MLQELPHEEISATITRWVSPPRPELAEGSKPILSIVEGHERANGYV